MSSEEAPKSKESEAADEMESEMEERDESRREHARIEQQDLNQGMDTGTHDSTHPGINWTPSYRTSRKRTKPKNSSEKRKGNSD
jgi:hypothetical protein